MRLNNPYTAALLILTPCAVHQLQAATPGTEKKPNILLAISDDQSWCHTSLYGDPTVKTPNIDEVARAGIVFSHAFCAAPTSTASRAGLLTGQNIWRLEGGAQLHGPLPAEFKTYPEILEENGYFIGYSHKGWGPGDYEEGGRDHNPAGGKSYPNLEEFLKHVPEGQPWCFWYGSWNPHRSYKKDIGINNGIKTDRIEVPGIWPDVPEVRNDIADYYYQVERFDEEVGRLIKTLKEQGEFDNTLVAVTGDNGMPFPRGKATLYDYGVREPLAICWGNRIVKGREVDDFVSLIDLAPTFLEAAGVDVPETMTGRSLMKILDSKKSGDVDRSRKFITAARERHAIGARPDNAGYAIRMIRTKKYLYIRNYNPERWPAGDPKARRSYGDVDGSPTKDFILSHKDEKEYAEYYRLCFMKRPQEELYDVVKDPCQLHNLAGDRHYAGILSKLSKMLTDYQIETGDPRETGKKIIWK